MKIYNTYSDRQLIAFLKKGDVLAYSEIFDRFQPLLFLHAFKKVNSEDDAKDIVQEIFIDLWLRRRGFDHDINLAAYLYTCVRNKFVNLLQHQQIRVKYIDSFKDFICRPIVPADELMIAKQLQEVIEREINTLPGKMREVFLLSRMDRKSYKEIARELNVSQETVRKQIKNSLKILRTRLRLIIYLVLLLRY